MLMTSLDEFIRYLECNNEQGCYVNEYEINQLAELLRELKAYRGLSTYNRPCKCYECDYEDSEYYCDDCIWQFVDKFKPKEVECDVRLTNN